MMEIDFFNSQCQFVSNKKRFGLCDEQDNKEPAYLDEQNGAKWIAVVENEELKEVHFIAIDNCPSFKSNRSDGTMEKRCDGMLWYDGKNLIFVELKDRKLRNASEFIKEAALQLTTTINHFKKNYNIADYNIKAAYIASRKKIHRSYTERMKKFQDDTGCTLRIENRIKIPYI